MLASHIPIWHSMPMEHLKAYRREQGILQSAFAEMLGTTQTTISKLESGKITPNLALAHKIEVATGGAVPMSCWVQHEGEAS